MANDRVRVRSLSFALWAMVLLPAGPALCQDGDASVPVIFKDLNGDGDFGAGEISAGSGATVWTDRALARLMAAADADADGKVSPAELRAASESGLSVRAIQSAGQMTTTAAFADIDANMDGYLASAELSSVTIGAPPALAQAWSRAVMGADADGDGRISAGEWPRLAAR